MRSARKVFVLTCLGTALACLVFVAYSLNSISAGENRQTSEQRLQDCCADLRYVQRAWIKARNLTLAGKAEEANDLSLRVLRETGLSCAWANDNPARPLKCE